MAKLILNRVSKRFSAARPAVADFSLEIADGGFLALLGPSGCGKTTLLRMIAGFEQPSDGAIYLGERLISDASGVVPPERRNMAMVFQSYALWPHMTVADNVGYPLKMRSVGGELYRHKVDEALSTVRLGEFAERRPAELSGGQRQRVALARCLVTAPDVVLLDEPLANLDRHLRQEMEENFREFHRRSGATMVYVTHDQSEAMALSTQVAVMSEGRLLQAAPPEELYARPEGRLVGGLIGQGAILSLAADGDAGRLYDWPRLKKALWSGHEAAERLDVLVRPQDVVIGAEGLAARVVATTYEGERHAVKLELQDGQGLRSFSRVPLALGESLRVTVRAAWRL